MTKLIIDADNAILGRLASFAAKQSLLGKEVVILNCNNALLTGRRDTTLNEYKKARQRGGSSRKGPHFPKNPERIVKRTIRGMLSYKQQRGRDALKRIMCYNETPEEYTDSKKVKAGKEKTTKTTKLSEISKLI